MKTALVCFCLSLSTSVYAINVADVASGVTPAQMQAALTGTGVNISNLTITNPGNCPNFNRGVGVFSNGATAVGPGPVLGEPNGVIVSNSAFNNGNILNTSNTARNASNTLCNGTTSDPDMVAIESATVAGEYAAIEFDVIPQSSTLAIPFQFGSDEFPEYVCSNFNDLVGIFVSGPGINGAFSGALNAENFAKTAGGDLSSINWVNTGVVGQNGNFVNCGSLANAAFYTDNSNGDPLGGNATVALTNANLEMDGFTNTLFQPISVVPGQSYHVKIVVADSADRAWDSVAFIHPLFSTGAFSGFDFGDAPDSYRTLTSNGGPSHGIDSSIFMGATVPDNEITGIPTINADGDDLNNADDEDGVSSFPALITSATSYSVNVNVSNNSGRSARLVGWIDFNRNGLFESGEGTQTNIANGTTGATVALNWPSISGLVAGNSYARIRFSSDLGLSLFTTGSAMSDGEVEDYPLTIQTVNFDKFVSTNATCSDSLDSLTVTPGTIVFYCYTVSNPNAQAFVISPGNTSDDQGHDISGLEQNYPAGASQTVVIGPVIAGGIQLPTGGTTVNNAQVIVTINGTDVTNYETASLTVSLNPPISGVKPLYLDTLDVTPDLTRSGPTSNADNTAVTFGVGSSITVDQGITFQAPFTITGGTIIDAQLWLRRIPNNSGARTVQIEVFNGVTGASLGSNTQTWNANNMQLIIFSIALASDTNFAVGDFVRLVITNVSGGDVRLRTFRSAQNSQLQMQSNTVINVDSIAVFSAAYPATTQFTSYEPGSTVFIRSTVSDPFGSADITSANITITDSIPVAQVTNAAMASVDTPTGATRVYEFPYTIPATPDGFWNISITANEGSEGTVAHTTNTNMIVGTANITISKNSVVLSDPVNATNPKAIPGAIVEYTVAVGNTGFGYVDTNSFIISDPVVPGTTFYFGLPLNPVNFIDGAVASGLTFTFIDLASVIDDIDFSNDGGLSFITPTTDASGFDTTVPAINFIRINPKGELNGSDGTNNPSMRINFRVRVD